MTELSEKDIEFIKELRQASEDGRVSRRDAMKMAGALGIGGVVGGAGGASMFGNAAADASTSDEDGNVGLPGDRVDVFADGVDSTTIDTGEIDNAPRAGNYGDGSFQAALDAAGVDGAVVIPADTTLSPSSSLTYYDGQTIIGLGRSSVVDAAAVSGDVFTPNGTGFEDVVFSSFRITDDGTAADGIYMQQTVEQNYITGVEIDGVGGAGVSLDGCIQTYVRDADIYNCGGPCVSATYNSGGTTLYVTDSKLRVSDRGIEVSGGANAFVGVWVKNNVIEANDNDGAVFDGASRVFVRDNYFEDNGKVGGNATITANEDSAESNHYIIENNIFNPVNYTEVLFTPGADNIGTPFVWVENYMNGGDIDIGGVGGDVRYDDNGFAGSALNGTTVTY